MCVCNLPTKAVPEMTYTVSGGTLNPTHSLTHSLTARFPVTWVYEEMKMPTSQLKQHWMSQSLT